MRARLQNTEFESHRLNRDIWGHDTVQNVIYADFKFWQCDDVSPEGRTYTSRYKPAELPHVGIIDSLTGALLQVSGWLRTRTACCFDGRPLPSSALPPTGRQLT